MRTQTRSGSVCAWLVLFLQVGLFAGGLDSVAGGGDESGGSEEEEAMAGMRLSLLGYELRPYVFFVGTSELMSHVWSGTGSEPTPALQVLLGMTRSGAGYFTYGVVFFRKGRFSEEPVTLKRKCQFGREKYVIGHISYRHHLRTILVKSTRANVCVQL